MTNKKQLTRNEIIELRARAIVREMGVAYLKETDTTFWKCRRREAEATIKADEKAGVLALVEERDMAKSYEVKVAKVPVYNCKKEVSNDNK